MKALALPIIINCRDAIDEKKAEHYAYECSAPNVVSRTAENSKRQAAMKGTRCGSEAVAKRNIVTETKKLSGPVGEKHSTDTATSSEFAGLLKTIAPNTQSLCATASGIEISLITLKL